MSDDYQPDYITCMEIFCYKVSPTRESAELEGWRFANNGDRWCPLHRDLPYAIESE